MHRDPNGKTALMWSVISGNVRSTEILLAEKSDIDAIDRNDMTALDHAAQNGNVRAVQLLLKHGAQLFSDEKPQHAMSALAFAAKGGFMDCLKVLLRDANCTPEYINRMFGKFDEKTALDLAVKEGHLDCVRLLIKKGATVDVRMVYAAARGGHVACLEAVLQHVDTNELYFTSWSMHHPECLKLVLEKCSPINEDRLTQGLVSAACSSPPCVPIFLLYGANANGIASGERRTVLMCSMESASPDTVELLLKSGADPNATDASGRTPLFYAADEGREDLLDMLLKYGADVSIVDNFGGTVLMRATDPKFLNKVLEIGGVDVNAQDVETGRTALDLAITDVACMEVLLKHGATIGKNALIDAARYGSVTAVEFLLDRGAEVNVANDNGDTPLILACQYRSCDSMKSINLLVGLGAEVDAANKQGRTALMCAAARGDRQTVQLLLSRGADVDAVDEKGWTALLEAAMNGAAQCIELLQSKAKAAQKKRKRSA